MVEKIAVVALIDSLLASLPGEEATFDASHIRQNVMMQEMRQECAFLQGLLSESEHWDAGEEEAFKQQFREHCATRFQMNQGGGLCFTAYSSGHVNRTYWQLAIILFQPATMTEMIAILCPSIRDYVEFDWKPDRQGSGVRGAILDGLVKHPLSVLNEQMPLELDHLAHLMIVGDAFFDIQSLSYLSLQQHYAVYTLLKEKYPEYLLLYSRNAQLRALKDKLDILVAQGQPPKTVLLNFIKAANFAGTGMSGQTYALESVYPAYEALRVYIDSLPEELRAELLQLSSDGTSIEKVMQNLAKGECIETAARNLDHIMKSSENSIILSRTPHAIEHYWLQFKQQISHRHPISTLADEDFQYCLSLPGCYLETTVSKMKIEAIRDLVTILITCPVSLYPQLVSVFYASKPRFFLKIVEQFDLLDAPRRLALVTAILSQDHSDTMVFKMIEFSIDIKSKHIHRIDRPMIEFIKREYPQQVRLWHFLVGAASSDTQKFIENLQEIDRGRWFQALFSDQLFLRTVIEGLIKENKIDSFNYILRQFTVAEKKLGFEHYHHDVLGALYYAISASDLDFFKHLFLFIPQEQRFDFLTEKFTGIILELMGRVEGDWITLHYIRDHLAPSVKVDILSFIINNLPAFDVHTTPENLKGVAQLHGEFLYALLETEQFDRCVDVLTTPPVAQIFSLMLEEQYLEKLLQKIQEMTSLNAKMTMIDLIFTRLSRSGQHCHQLLQGQHWVDLLLSLDKTALDHLCQKLPLEINALMLEYLKKKCLDTKDERCERLLRHLAYFKMFRDHPQWLVAIDRFSPTQRQVIYGYAEILICGSLMPLLHMSLVSDLDQYLNRTMSGKDFVKSSSLKLAEAQKYLPVHYDWLAWMLNTMIALTGVGLVVLVAQAAYSHSQGRTKLFFATSDDVSLQYCQDALLQFGSQRC